MHLKTEYSIHTLIKHSFKGQKETAALIELKKSSPVFPNNLLIAVLYLEVTGSKFSFL